MGCTSSDRAEVNPATEIVVLVTGRRHFKLRETGETRESWTLATSVQVFLRMRCSIARAHAEHAGQGG